MERDVIEGLEQAFNKSIHHDDNVGLTLKLDGERYLANSKDPKQGQNQLNLAINAFTQAYELLNDPTILGQLVQCYLLNGQFSMAEYFLNQLLPNPSLPPETLKSTREAKAFLLVREGKLKDAAGMLTQAIHVAPWLKRGTTYFNLSRLQFELAHQEHRCLNVLKGFKNLGLAALTLPGTWSLKNFKLHLQFYLLKLSHSFSTPAAALETYLAMFQTYPGLEPLATEIGKVYAEQEKFTEAEFWFSRIIGRYPTSDEGYRNLINLYNNYHCSEQLTEALEDWLKIRPQSGEIMMVLSQALAKNAETYEKAIMYANQAMLTLKDSELKAMLYCHLGTLYSNIQSFDTAIMAFQAAISVDPQCLDAYIQLGTLYFDKQDYFLSQQIFEKALELAPNNAKILCNLGYLCWMQDKIQEAITYYQKSIQQDPGYDIALNNLGVLYLDHIGNIDKAIELFDQTLLFNPNYALCHYNKGRAYSFMGKSIEAAHCFLQAQALNNCSQELDDKELSERIRYLFDNPNSSIQTDLRD